MQNSTYDVDLCAKVLNYVAFSSPVAGGKTPSEIKLHLSEIFPEQVINSAVAILCGEQLSDPSTRRSNFDV